MPGLRLRCEYAVKRDVTSPELKSKGRSGAELLNKISLLALFASSAAELAMATPAFQMLPRCFPHVS